MSASRLPTGRPAHIPRQQQQRISAVADHRHKRDTNARRFPKAHLVAGPLAFLATASVVGFGVLATTPAARETILASESVSPFDLVDRAERDDVVSRSDSRAELVNLQRAFDVNTTRMATLRAVRNADTKLWATVDLNLWTSPERDARKVGLLKSGERVLVTGRKTPERVEIVWKGEPRWVTAGYLSEDKPVGGGDIDASCTNGTTVPAGVSPNIVAVHQAVCANFPEITTYGTFRGDGEHAQGIAVDIMVSGDRGWQVAEFVRAHYAELGVSYVIYSQRIWSVERAGEGWRYMSDRGSTTANHYDHVHVTTY
jgi:hypothetical protein